MNAKGCGALLGLAIGDALGAPNEGEMLTAPAFPELASAPLTGMLGGGSLDLRPGQVTDDTHMACCLYGSLSSIGHFDAHDVAARYVEWAKVTFDIGMQTYSALAVVADDVSPLMAGMYIWLKGGKYPAANGSLMRTAPIGVLLAGSEHDRRVAALNDSAITHFDPRCRLSCAAYDAAIAAAVNGTRDAKTMWQAAFDEIAIAGEVIARQYEAHDLAVARAAVETDLRAAAEDDPDLYGTEVHLHEHMGFVRVAFRLAFWELLHRATFRDAVLDAANRGGDADTNAAIVGALVGSRVGVDGIPEQWRTAVLDCEPSGLAVWTTTYHPRVFGC